jgi:hypothetical protein
MELLDLNGWLVEGKEIKDPACLFFLRTHGVFLLLILLANLYPRVTRPVNRDYPDVVTGIYGFYARLTLAIQSVIRIPIFRDEQPPFRRSNTLIVFGKPMSVPMIIFWPLLNGMKRVPIFKFNPSVFIDLSPGQNIVAFTSGYIKIMGMQGNPITLLGINDITVDI